ncbi:MAG: DNA polymerase III subunit beta, partial [Clostridia bacterium]
MKFVCNGNDFADALAKVTKALPIKKVQPILEGIKLSAHDDCLTLSATDFDFAIIKKIKADVKMEGDILIPGKLINELARKLSGENEIELSDISDNNLTIKYSDSSTFLKVMNLEEYPQIKELEYDLSITLLQKDLKDLINRTIFATATDDNRPILKGVLFELDGNVIKAVALDGYRLAVCSKKLEQDFPLTKIIVPAKSLSEISKLLEEDEQTVVLNISSNKMLVDIKHTKIITSLLGGKFINYQDTIPKDFDIELTINRTQLADAIERASILSRYEKSNLIKLEVKEGKLTISSNSEMGESKEIISIFVKGKDINIGVNAKFFADCLKTITDEYVIVRLNNANSPITIVPLANEEDSVGYI